MKVTGSPYMEWIKDLEMPRVNLAFSGMHFNGTAADLGLKAEKMALSDFSPYGLPDLKSALNRRYGVPEKNILLNIGTSGCNYLLFSTMFEPGDEVLVETPVYDIIPNALKQLGFKVVDLPRRFENGYLIDEDELENLMGENCKAVVLTNLHNPSGVLLTDEHIKSLSRICKRRGCWLIIDEIYLEFYFGKGPGTAFHQSDNIIVTSGLNKAFGLGGLRAGWCFAPEDIVAGMLKLYNLMGNMNPYITEYIAFRVLADDEIYGKFAETPMRLMEENIPLVEDFIDSRPDLEWVKPDWGISCFPRAESVERSEAIYRLLLEEYETFVIPGRFFFDPGCFRLSYGIEREMLIEGLENIGKALDRV